jgi:hypothetical protein
VPQRELSDRCQTPDDRAPPLLAALGSDHGIPIPSDSRQVVDRNSAPRETKLNGVHGKYAWRFLDPEEALLLTHGNDLAVFQEDGSGMMTDVVTSDRPVVDSEDVGICAHEIDLPLE